MEQTWEEFKLNYIKKHYKENTDAKIFVFGFWNVGRIQRIEIDSAIEECTIFLEIKTAKKTEIKMIKIKEIEKITTWDYIYVITNDNYKEHGNKLIKKEQENYLSQEELIVQKCDELKELLIHKNRDYGNSAQKSFEKWGNMSFMIRIEDKMNRIENLIKNGENNLVKDESLYDSVLDSAGYFLLWLVEMGKKEHKKND